MRSIVLQARLACAMLAANAPPRAPCVGAAKGHTMLTPQSYAAGRWIGPGPQAQTIIGPVTGQPIAQAGGSDLDFAAMLDWAKTTGGPALRAMGFHQRAKLLKQLASYLDSRKDALYALNPLTGATRKDGWVDIEGGIGTMFLIASKGRREMPDGQVYIWETPQQPSWRYRLGSDRCWLRPASKQRRLSGCHIPSRCLRRLDASPC